MERIVRGRSATLTHTFYSSATATDPSPDTTTVTITRADGTAVVTGASATEAGTGKVTYTVTPAQTALLDKWTVDWVATFGGQSQTFRTFVEVAGDVLFTLAEAKAISALASLSDSTIASKRAQAEQTLERAFSIAFVPRYELETLSGDGTSMLLLKWPKIRAIRSATVSGTALTSSDLANLTFDQNGILTGYTWPRGTGNIVLGYEHGWDYPPEPIRDAALAIANYSLTSGKIGSEGVDGRIEYITTPEGRINYGSGALGLPAVQRAASLYDMSVGVA